MNLQDELVAILEKHNAPAILVAYVDPDTKEAVTASHGDVKPLTILFQALGEHLQESING